MRHRGGRLPSEAELALWAEVARTVHPLPGRRLPALAKSAPVPSAPPAAPANGLFAPVPPAPKPLPPLAPLERRLRMALKRGTESIEGVIDLHGMRQDEAHAALISFLHRAQQRGARLLLVVTGKGGGGVAADGHERGVLRRVVPHWLRLPELRPLVLGFEEAAQGHGGAGALYVRLRRGRGSAP